MHCVKYIHSGCLILACWGLTACSPSQHQETATGDNAGQNNTESTLRQDAENAHKLTDVAGKASVPMDEGRVSGRDIKAYEQPLAGRYMGRMSCQDDFARCDKGSAEYILNLLPDGTAHRTIIHYGKIVADAQNETINNSAINYRKDSWFVNETEQEVVVHLVEGANFYFKIDPSGNLIMNLDKINNPENIMNRELFARGYPQPSEYYVLIKDKK